jgi:hypothetical protein
MCSLLAVAGNYLSVPGRTDRMDWKEARSGIRFIAGFESGAFAFRISGATVVSWQAGRWQARGEHLPYREDDHSGRQLRAACSEVAAEELHGGTERRRGPNDGGRRGAGRADHE